MTNKELKEKICDIIAPYVSAYGDDERIADALIAAGICDVSCLREHRVIAEYSIVPDDGNPYIIPSVPLRVTQLYSGEEVEQIVKEREEYKHRAEVAESALKLACYDKARTYFPNVPNEEYENRRDKYYREYVEKSEKELAEEGKDE